MQKPKQFPLSQSDSDSSTLCMICHSRFFHTADSINQQFVFAEILTDLFHMFLNDLKWDPTDGMYFNFEKEAFPFCECCRLILLNLRSLHDQVDNLTKQIHQIVANINAKILMSGNDIENNKGSEVGGECPDQHLPNVDANLLNMNSSIPQETATPEVTKIQRFRKLAFKYYKPDVSIATTLRTIANIHVAKLATLLSNSSVENSLETVSGDSVDSESNHPGSVSPEFSSNDYAVEVEEAKPEADVNPRNDKPAVTRRKSRIQKQKHSREKPRSGVIPIKWVKTGDSYLYENQFLAEKVDGIMYCRSCPYTSTATKHMTTHVRAAHIEKKNTFLLIRVLEVGEKLYQYGKYMFEKLEDGKFLCKSCGNIKKTTWEIKSHIRHIHCQTAKGKQYTCEVCGKCFYWLSLLQKHVAVHGDIRSHVCEICGESFKQYSALYHHKKHRHEGVRKVPRIVICDVCGKRTSKRRLQDHMNSHTGEKPYKCHICNKSFGSSNVLTVHQNVHKEKKYSCDICGMTFTQQQSIKRHKGTAHP